MRGYTRIFENMLLDNPAITIRLNVDFFKARLHTPCTHLAHTPHTPYTPCTPYAHPTQPTHPYTHPNPLPYLFEGEGSGPAANPNPNPDPNPNQAREAGQLPKFGMLVYTGQIDSYYAQLGMPT